MFETVFIDYLPWLQPWLLVCLVWLIKAVIPAANTHKFWHGFALYCQLLSNKVNKTKNSEHQQVIAGFLALLISIVPIALILMLFGNLVTDAWLWQLVLLYFSVEFMPLKPLFTTLVQDNDSQKQQARLFLQPYALRETSKLSRIGLIKAGIEVYVLRQAWCWLTPTILFLLFGGVAAIVFRCILVMHQTWHVKLLKFQFFGQFSAQAVGIIAWLPIRLYWLVLIIVSAPTHLVNLAQQAKPFGYQLNANILLNLMSQLLACRLGGIAMYQGIKRRKLSFNDSAQEPSFEQLIKTKSLIFQANIFILAITGLMSVFAAIIAFSLQP